MQDEDFLPMLSDEAEEIPFSLSLPKNRSVFSALFMLNFYLAPLLTQNKHAYH